MLHSILEKVCGDLAIGEEQARRSSWSAIVLWFIAGGDPADAADFHVHAPALVERRLPRCRGDKDRDRSSPALRMPQPVGRANPTVHVAPLGPGTVQIFACRCSLLRIAPVLGSPLSPRLRAV
mmetsp:Transcript_22608/g.70755  ORF Transcript_22608/g.70755 Transcript_22608/m.70755 type:complete len:123 (-) Transcript_22608:144-512(-)